MNKRIVTILLLSTIIATHGQTTTFTKTPAIALHAAFIDFTGADSLRAFGRYTKPSLALSYQNSFSRKWDYSVTVSGSFLDFTDRQHKSLGNGKEHLLLEADVAVRRHLLAPGNLFRPYVQAGTGISSFKNYWGVFIPAGAGCQIGILPDVFVLLNAQYRLPVTTTQHRHFYYSIGLAGVIGRKKMIKPKQTFQPLPTVRVAPTPIDSDGDGIVDSVDQCAHAVGLARYQGCPPPYKDRDDIGVQHRLDSAARHIFFATGLYTLLPQSFAPLNEVAAILKDHPGCKLIIEGHTDNTGTPSANQVLSENRARTVMDYLISASIHADRLKANGYGSGQPVSTNQTPEGRAKNRRVVLKLVY